MKQSSENIVTRYTNHPGAGTRDHHGRTARTATPHRDPSRVETHPEWSRPRVANDLCERWQWQTPKRRGKTFAARSLLLTLEVKHGLRLPAVRVEKRRAPWGIKRSEGPAAPGEPIAEVLAGLRPLQWCLAGRGTAEREQALGYLRTYHYLGCDRPVGANLVYLVRDRTGRELAVHLVGATAWQCAARDRAIGWDAVARAHGLGRIANRSRFRVLPSDLTIRPQTGRNDEQVRFPGFWWKNPQDRHRGRLILGPEWSESAGG